MDLTFPTTAGALSLFLQAKLIGDAAAPVTGLASLEDVAAGSLSFLADKKLRSRLEKVKGGVLVTSAEFVNENFPLTYLVVTQPKIAFARVAQQLVPSSPWSGISPLALIDHSAKLGDRVSVGPFTTIAAGVEIGAGTVIYSHSYIGPDVRIGRDCEIRSRVTLESRTELGDRVKVFSGSVLGSEGFGMIPTEDGAHSEMPQLGHVVIGSDVRIGANCTVDRGTLGETLVGEGTKFDDHVHVGHNVKIGKNCILCAQVGVGGSVIIGDNVILGGQVGLGDHIVVGDGAILGGQTGASTNLKGGEMYSLSPAMPLRESHRMVRLMRKLPEFRDRLDALEEKLGIERSDER